MTPNEPPPSNADSLSVIIDSAASVDEQSHEALVDAFYDRLSTLIGKASPNARPR
jgi:hypothetical protein